MEDFGGAEVEGGLDENPAAFADCDRMSRMVRPLNLWELLGG